MAHAAPVLRLVDSTVGPITVGAGASPASRVVEAYNTGDGSLNLQASVSPNAPWLVATIAVSRTCTTTNLAKTCIAINLAMNTSALAAGTYTGIVTISDPNAVDAPQTITVTVQVGGSVPASKTVYVAPGGSVDVPIVTNSALRSTSSASWLSLSISGQGSFQFVYPYQIHVAPDASNTPGTYSGTLTLSDSTFSGDNRAVTVTMNVTTQPIAQATVNSLDFRMAQGAPPLSAPFSPAVRLTNIGQGTLAAQPPAITLANGGTWLKYDPTTGYTWDVTGLSPGFYTGSIPLASNAVNGTVTVPVSLTVVPKGPPQITYQGVQDNATFIPGDTVAQGDIMVVKGDQLSFSAPVYAGGVPLPPQLADTSVLVNGTAVPLFYSSYRQIAFQMPVNVPVGTAQVQVRRDDGTTSNIVTVNVAARAPRILNFTVGDVTYGIIQNPDDSLTLPVTAIPGLYAHPAKAGDTVTIYAIGLGATSPAVVAGAQGPVQEPLARVVSPVSVAFGRGIVPVIAQPDYAGLSGYVGLYQVNVTIPRDAPKGIVFISLGVADAVSNQVALAIE